MSTLHHSWNNKNSKHWYATRKQRNKRKLKVKHGKHEIRKKIKRTTPQSFSQKEIKILRKNFLKILKSLLKIKFRPKFTNQERKLGIYWNYVDLMAPPTPQKYFKSDLFNLEAAAVMVTNLALSAIDKVFLCLSSFSKSF